MFANFDGTQYKTYIIKYYLYNNQGKIGARRKNSAVSTLHIKWD